jgi:triacylglycerol esterase/lipase EstA (alpha/beta hydrolase family)
MLTRSRDAQSSGGTLRRRFATAKTAKTAATARAVMAATAATAATAALLAIAAPGAQAAYSPYPVTFSVPAAVLAAAASSTTPPPGANDWSCKPSAAHPEPVVLVHGLAANMVDNWDTMAPLLADNGFCVYAFTYGNDPGEPYIGGLQAMENSAPQLAAFVNEVLAATGASKVDLVGHSEGTVMPRYYMEFLGGAAKVDRYVMLTPIWHGTDVLGLSTLEQLGDELDPSAIALVDGLFGTATTCGSCAEFLTGSPFLQNLDAHGMALPHVTYTDIVTKYDELVVPYTNGILNSPGVTNITLQDQCPTDFSDHLAVAFDPTAAQDILNALDPAHARAVPCTLVLPGVGAPLAPATVGLG